MLGPRRKETFSSISIFQLDGDDGVADDDCENRANTDQADADGIGDVCDVCDVCDDDTNGGQGDDTGGIGGSADSVTLSPISCGCTIAQTPGAPGGAALLLVGLVSFRRSGRS